MSCVRAENENDLERNSFYKNGMHDYADGLSREVRAENDLERNGFDDDMHLYADGVDRVSVGHNFHGSYIANI